MENLENNTQSEMTLYGLGIESSIFLDLNEYENFPEDGICGPMGEREHMDYDGIEPIEYIRCFDEKIDVFKRTCKNGEVIYYYLATQNGYPRVKEGKLVDGKISWNLSDVRSLTNAYKGFRKKGISFVYDYYLIQEYLYEIREKQVLVQYMCYKKTLNEIEALLQKVDFSQNNDSAYNLQENSGNTNKVKGFFKKLAENLKRK